MAVDLGTAIAYLDLDTSKFDDGLSKASSGLENFSTSAEKIGGSVKKAGDAIADVGQGMTKAFTLPIVGGFTAAVKTGMEFEGAMSEVKSVTRSLWDDQDVTGEKFKELSEYALEWGGKTKFTTTEVANALKYMGMAGWEYTEMMGGLPGVLNLAAAGNLDLARTSDIVTDTLTAFGEKADQAGRFADVLAVASANSNTNVDMMGETFKYVGPIAGALGYSIEDVALATGLMANSGIKATQAGTTLRRGLTNMTKPTDAMQAKMVQLGLATAETANVMNQGDIDKAAAKVATKTLDMEKAQLKYNAAVEEYGEGSNRAQQAAIDLEKANVNLQAAVDELTAAQEGNIEVVGFRNTLMYDEQGNARDLKDVLIDLRSTFAGLSEEEQLQAAATIFGTNALSGMVALVTASDEDFNTFAEAIDNSAGAAEEMARILMDNLKGDMDIFLSQLSIAAQRIYEDFVPSLRQIVQALTKAVEWFNSLDEGQRKNIERMAIMVAAAGPMITMFGKTTSAVGGLITGLGKVTSVFDLFHGTISKITGVTDTFRIKTKETNLNALELGEAMLKTDNDTVKLGKGLSDTKEKILQFGNQMKSTSKDTNELDESLTRGVKLADQSKMSFGALFKSFSLGIGVIAAIVAAIALLVAGFLDAYRSSEEVRQAVSQLFDVLSRFGQSLIQILGIVWKTLEPIISAVVKFVSMLIQTLLPPLVSILSAIQSVLEILTPILGVLFEWIGKIVGAIVEYLIPVFQFVAELIAMVAEAIAFLVEKISDFVKKLFGIKDDFKSAAKGATDGFKEGIDEGSIGIDEKLKGLAGGAVTSFGEGLGIDTSGGLSTVFESFGLGTGESYSVGVEESTPGAVAAVDNMSTQVEGAFQGHIDRVNAYYDEELESWNNFLEVNLQKMEDYHEEGVISEEQYAENIQNIKKQHNENVTRLEDDRNRELKQLNEEAQLSYEEQLKGHTKRIEDRHKSTFDNIENQIVTMNGKYYKEYEAGYISQEELLKKTCAMQEGLKKDHDEEMLLMQREINEETEYMEKVHGEELLKAQGKPLDEIKKKTIDSREEVLKHQKGYSEESIKTATSMVDETNTKLTELSDNITDVSETLWTPLITKTADAMNQVNDIINQAIGSIINKLNDLQNQVNSRLSSMNYQMSSYSSYYNGYHASGLDYVPFNGYMAQLHEGERVLTKQENRDYMQGTGSNGSGGDTFNFYNVKDDPYEYARQMKRVKKELAFG